MTEELLFPRQAVRECPVCLGVFVGRRNRRYCSKKCARVMARRRRQADRVVYHR